jgi:asparagine synthase (glutamine-hydrolysing)
VTVALSGDGPDEMLAGYRRYRFDLPRRPPGRWLPAWLRRSTFGLAGRLCPKADWLPRSWRAKRTLQNLADDDATAHLRSVSLAAGELPGMLLSADLHAELAGHDPFERGRDLFNRCASPHLLNRCSTWT